MHIPGQFGPLLQQPMNPAIEVARQAVCGRLLGELVADLVERLLSERLLDEPAGMLLDDVGFGYDLLDPGLAQLTIEEIDELARCHRVQLDPAGLLAIIAQQERNLLLAGTVVAQRLRSRFEATLDRHRLRLQIHR
jgi:hypothetical protein